MKTCALVCLLLLFGISRSLAQNNSARYRAKIDSLQALMTHQLKEDTLMVKRLNYLAQICFYDLQYQRGLVATKQARLLAQKLHYATGEGLYRRTLATFNQFNQLGGYYDILAKWFYADHQQKEARYQFGINSMVGRASEKAKVELQTALTYFEKQSDKEIIANLLFQQAIYSPNPNQHDEIMDKAGKLFRENHQEAAAVYCLLAIMQYWGQSKPAKQAKTAENESLKIILNAKSRREAALLHYRLGTVYESLNRQDASYEQTQKADQLLEQLGEKDLRVQVFRQLGLVCTSLSFSKKAAEYFKKEVALREETKNVDGLIWIYHKVAFTLIELKAFQEARSYIAKAETVSDKDDEPVTRLTDKAQHYDAVGQILMGEQNYPEAILAFNQSLTYANALARYSFFGGVISFYVKYYIAHCYQKLGNVPESIRYGKQSYDLASQFGMLEDGRVVKQKSSLLLSQMYEQAGEPIEAFKYLKIHQKIRSETDQREATNRLLDLEVQSIIDKNEQEKNRLNQEKLLQQQRILAIEKQQEIDRLKAQSTNQRLQNRAEQAELGRQLDNVKSFQNKRQQDYQISLLNLDINNQRKIRLGLLSGLAFFVLFVVALFRQNRVKQRLNQTLITQKAEIEQQRDQLDHTLTELKTTQGQLIQK